MTVHAVLRAWLRTRMRGERGANLVEYILLVAFIALAVVAAVAFFGDDLGTAFDDAGSRVSEAPN